MSEQAFFAYIPVFSPIHGLDPRTKMVIMLSLIVTAIAIPSWCSLAFLATLVIVAFLYVLARIPIRIIFRYMYLLTFVGVILFLFQLFLFPSILGPGGQMHVICTLIPQDVPVVGGWGVITYEGLLYGIQTVARFLVIMLSFFLFLATTSIDSFTLALRKMRFPYTWAFLLSTTFHYLPVLSTEWGIVREAQISRGLSMKGGILKKIKSSLRIMGPVFVNSIVRSEDIALALESRAFDLKRPRTERKILKMGVIDFVAIVLSAVILATVLFIRFFL